MAGRGEARRSKFIVLGLILSRKNKERQHGQRVTSYGDRGKDLSRRQETKEEYIIIHRCHEEIRREFRAASRMGSTYEDDVQQRLCRNDL